MTIIIENFGFSPDLHLVHLTIYADLNFEIRTTKTFALCSQLPGNRKSTSAAKQVS